LPPIRAQEPLRQIPFFNISLQENGYPKISLVNKLMYDDFEDKKGSIVFSSSSNNNMEIKFPNLKEKKIGYCPVMDIESPNFIDFVNFEMEKSWTDLYEDGAVFPPELFTKYRSKLENRSNLKFKQINESMKLLFDSKR
jgi:hypothetical protein